jgi:hypothetical protein
MERYPVLQADADGCDLPRGSFRANRFRCDENAGSTRNRSSAKTKPLEALDQGLLDSAKKQMNVGLPPSFEVDNQIAHQLAGRVVGHIAAPRNFMNIDFLVGQHLTREQEIRLPRTPAKGDHRRMFEQQKPVARHSVPPGL